jgi:hypothetical protein
VPVFLKKSVESLFLQKGNLIGGRSNDAEWINCFFEKERWLEFIDKVFRLKF